MTWQPFRVTYFVSSSNQADLDVRVESLLLEQTVELPRTALRDKFVLEEIVGRLHSVEKIGESERRGDDLYRVVIDFPLSAIGKNAGHFLNVLFGNSSLQEHVQLIDFEFPEGWAEREEVLPGPQFGLVGWRERIQAVDRPVTCTALKPIGLSVTRLAELAGLFAGAGIDVIKDDHGLGTQSFHPFEERVRACHEAVTKANAETGRSSVYVPNLIGSSSEVLQQLKFAMELGVGGVMFEPMVIGMPFFAELIRDFCRVPVLGHPSFAGALRIAPELMFGKLFPLFGADATIFANFGGRFAYSQATCKKIATELTQPSIKNVAPSFPVPAGGIKYHRVQESLEFYGKDVMLLIGGGLYEAGDEKELRARAEEFVKRCE